MRVEFVSRANHEFLSALQFYESETAAVGGRFLEDVERCVELIAHFPALGTPAPGDTRRVHLPHFPHSLVYQRTPDVIWVVAVEHHRQKPNLWLDRL